MMGFLFPYRSCRLCAQNHSQGSGARAGLHLGGGAIAVAARLAGSAVEVEAAGIRGVELDAVVVEGVAGVVADVVVGRGARRRVLEGQGACKLRAGCHLDGSAVRGDEAHAPGGARVDGEGAGGGTTAVGGGSNIDGEFALVLDVGIGSHGSGGEGSAQSDDGGGELHVD
jgi:hypothetical protein